MRLISLLAAAWLAAQAGTADDFHRMVAAERAFAAATKQIGVRDGFLTFFADDAIDVVPAGGRLGLVKAKERLRAQPPARQPLITELTWEPRWGAISTAGDLGWLTGPYRIHSVGSADADRHGAYFSIWRRQPDHTYKVVLDIGIATARALTFPDSFPTTIAPAAAAAGPAAADADMRAIEARFAAAASADLAGAYRSSLLADARLHRNERSPFVGAGAFVTFVSSTFDRVTWSVLHAEVARSGDLGFTAGSYEAAAKSSDGRPGSNERGFFVRVWHRAADGGWKIAFETNGIR